MPRLDLVYVNVRQVGVGNCLFQPVEKIVLFELGDYRANVPDTLPADAISAISSTDRHCTGKMRPAEAENMEKQVDAPRRMGKTESK
jgi:hypothetical protein